jgi:hypothetical protein
LLEEIQRVSLLHRGHQTKEIGGGGGHTVVFIIVMLMLEL